MVGVAQLVRAPGCGPGGRGFKSRRSPPNFNCPLRLVVRTQDFRSCNRGSTPLGDALRDRPPAMAAFFSLGALEIAFFLGRGIRTFSLPDIFFVPF